MNEEKRNELQQEVVNVVLEVIMKEGKIDEVMDEKLKKLLGKGYDKVQIIGLAEDVEQEVQQEVFEWLRDVEQEQDEQCCSECGEGRETYNTSLGSLCRSCVEKFELEDEIEEEVN